MHAVGIDTHKDSLAACLVDERGAAQAERTFANTPAGHRGLLAWIDGSAAELIIGIEGSASFGAPAARFLVAAGRRVREVPPQLSRRERGRTRRAGKSDPADALAIARVTLRESNLPPVRLLDRSLELQLLVEAREDLVAEQTRVRNRLHADLRSLLRRLWRHGRQPDRRAPPADGGSAAAPPAGCPGRACPRSAGALAPPGG